MPTKAAKKSDSGVQFPIRCASWDEVDRIKRKYLKPKGKGPKGQPVYDYDELARLVIFPAEQH